MSGYTETIRRWAADNRRAGTLPDADGIGEVGLGEDEAGKRLAARFFLRIREDRIEELRYQVFGCGFSMAACAAAAELALHRTPNEASRLSRIEVENLLGGLPQERGYCSELAVEALHAAVDAARVDSRRIEKILPPQEAHGPHVTAADPLYRNLMDSPCPAHVDAHDRHLFACLLCVATEEAQQPATALGLSNEDFEDILNTLFPDIPPGLLGDYVTAAPHLAPEQSDDILALLMAHIPNNSSGTQYKMARWLVRILTARAARPGHLWVAMGLFERPQLSAAIARHLPSLAAANHQGMRWKRYLYKQVCEQQGGRLCKAPACGLCSDYAMCFPHPSSG